MWWFKAALYHQPTTSKNQRLLHEREVPEYMREDSITHGYRQKLSFASCISSCFLLHNETINIWTHLIGTLVFTYDLFHVVFYPPDDVTHLDLAPVITQLITYWMCMMSSTLFHTFSCHSEWTYRTFLKTDQLAILAAFFGTYVAFISQVFECTRTWKYVHMVVAASLCLAVSCLSFYCPKNRKKIRVELFLAVVVYFPAVFAHWAWLKGGFSTYTVMMKLQQVIIPFTIGTIGLVFYLTRFPEKTLKKGSFNLIGASHQVWHVMVFLGMLYWYRGISAISTRDHLSTVGGETGCEASVFFSAPNYTVSEIP